MSEWITDRLPTAEDALSTNVLIWIAGKVDVWTYYTVAKGTPWQPIPKPAPYVEPKRWSLHSFDNGWILREKDHCCSLPSCSSEAAQRIEDVFNEVLP